MSDQNYKWSKILKAIDTKTKVLALICLVLEASLIAVIPQIPESQRIYAFLIGAGVFIIMIIGIFVIELTDVQSHKRNNGQKNSNTWKIRDRTSTGGKDLLIEGEGFDQFRTALTEIRNKEVEKSKQKNIITIDKEQIQAISDIVNEVNKFYDIIIQQTKNNKKK